MSIPFEKAEEWWLQGTPEMVVAILRRTAEDLRSPGRSVGVEEGKHRSGVRTLTIRIGGEPGGGGPVGQIQIVELPGGRTSLRVPRGRGSVNPDAWRPDADGSFFRTYLEAAVAELARSAFRPQSPEERNRNGDAYRESDAAATASTLLTEEQQDLLVLIVEENRSFRSRGGQQEFCLVETVSGGADLIVVPGGNNIPAFRPDLEELDRKDLIRLRRDSGGYATFVVSPEGFLFYEELKRHGGEPVERVEAETRHLLKRDLVDAYPEASAKWREAEDLLWKPDAEEQLTAIGHKCREALQSFGQALYDAHCPEGEALPKEQTLKKIAAVLESKRSALGQKTYDFMDAYLNYLDGYWRRVDGLAQRAEHGSQASGRPLVWEDARRLVFHTMLVMVEIASATR